MDLLHLYLTKYAKKAADGGERSLDALSSSVGMESDSDTTDSAPAAGGLSTGTRGATAATTGSTAVGPATGSPAAGTAVGPATGSPAAGTAVGPATGSTTAGTAAGTTGSTTAGFTPTSVAGITSLEHIPPFILYELINEVLRRDYNSGYRNPMQFRHEEMKKVDEVARTALDEVFKSLPEIDNPINNILKDARREREELMRRGAQAVLDSYAGYRTLQAARGIYPRNPEAANVLQSEKRRRILEQRMYNHTLVAKEREAHIQALAQTVKGLKETAPVPSFDEVFDYAKLIVPNTFGITGYPNKARANVILKDLARYAALREDPDSEGVVNGVAAALDRLKSGPVSQVGRARDEYIVERGLKYLSEKSNLNETTLMNVFGAGNSEYKHVVANVVRDAETRRKLGL
jgi:hypothetical protein